MDHQYPSRGERQSSAGEGPQSATDRRAIRLLLAAFVSAAMVVALFVALDQILWRVAGLDEPVADGTLRFWGMKAGDPARSYRVDYDRVVTVEFTGTVMPGLPWEMRPLSPSLTVHPGQVRVVKYLVRNLSHRRVEGQVIPGISPGQAAGYFQQVECFCFAHQTLAPGEEREMAVAFVIRPGLDPQVQELVLAYAFLPVRAARIVAFGGSPAVATADG